MTQLMMIIQFLVQSPRIPARSPASQGWSTEVHHLLIRSAFGQEPEDCLLQMESGSDQVDSLWNQGSENSYQHAMRAKNESEEDARSKMAHFIRDHYEVAMGFRDQMISQEGRPDADPLPRLQFCFYRGSALHPIMDTSSPAHEGFQIWSPFDILTVLKHGSFPTSIEDLKTLLSNPDQLKWTVGLMQMIDQLYLKLEMRDFLFEMPRPQTENRTKVAPLVPAS
jgi:hypothetical protein